VLPLNSSGYKSLDFVINCVFRKVFSTNSNDIITYCREMDRKVGRTDKEQWKDLIWRGLLGVVLMQRQKAAVSGDCAPSYHTFWRSSGTFPSCTFSYHAVIDCLRQQLSRICINNRSLTTAHLLRVPAADTRQMNAGPRRMTKREIP
jgi:hypothetical protein